MRLSGLAAIALLGSTFAYPAPPTDATVDTYYGSTIPDPYRPLESIDAPATRAWVEAEAALTRSYLDAIPQRAAIRSHLQAIANYERYTVPFHVRDRYFYLYNPGLAEQSVLYTMRGPNGTPRVLIDPNAMSADGSVTLGGEQPSWDARYLAYSTHSSGSDWETWRVRDIASGKDLPDTLQWSKFSSAAWAPDASGFYYERYPAPAAGEAYKGALSGQSVAFHRLGTPQSSDAQLYFRRDH
ncbi:MAG: S9 family peptidase, partial [Candidatus Eremiobacteraeota bacterium]|nr:S9 family peptidase [Candidatus Eremiobacteraeota bacterium]